MDAPDHVMSRVRQLLDLDDPEDDGRPEAPALPPVVGHYRIGRILGTGASAIVCEAEDLSLKRRVALKVLRDVAENRQAQFLARFHREASLAAALRHPNIVTIHEVAMFRQPDGSALHYIVMDCVPRTLRDEMAEGRIAPERAARVVASVARAIHHAHQKGIVHRDLKPANILLDDEGGPVVTDFGLAKDVSSADRLTQAGAALGTPLYMSPEQVSGSLREIGPATDVYALGTILYEILAGRPPFDGNTVGEIYAKILRDDPPDARSTGAGVKGDLAAICRKAMDKDPAARYRTAEALAQDLDRFLAGETVAALRTNPLSQIGRALRRYPGRIAMAAALVALAASIPFIARWAGERGSAGVVLRNEAWRKQQRRASADLAAFFRMPRNDPRSAEFRARAGRSIRDLVGLDPARIEGHILEFEMLTDGAGPAEQLAALETVSRSAPDHPRILFLRWKLRLTVRLNEQVVDFNRRASQGGFDSGGVPFGAPEPALHKEVGDALARMEGSDEVEPHERALIEGLLAMVEGRQAEAVLRIGAYLQQAPPEAAILQIRAQARIESGDAAGALKDLDAAILHQPGNPAAFQARAQARSATGDATGALADLDRHPRVDDPQWQGFRGKLLGDLRRLDEAIEAYGHAVRLEPSNGYWLIVRSRLRRARGDAPGALADASAAADLGGATRPSALWERSILHHDSGRFELALRDWEEVALTGDGPLKIAARAQIGMERYQKAVSSGSDSSAEMKAIIELCTDLIGEDASLAVPHGLRAWARFELVKDEAAPARETLRQILGDADAGLARPMPEAMAAELRTLRDEIRDRLGLKEQ